MSCSLSDSNQDTLNEYATRLGRVLDSDITVKFEHTTTFPNKSDLALEIPVININLREFYQFNQCPIATLVAQRNTSIGKFQPLSQRLFYERDLLAAFKQCTQLVPSDSELHAELLNWQAQKGESYPLSWASLIQQGDEIYQSFSQTRGDFSVDNTGVYNQWLQDFKLIMGLYDPLDSTITSKQVEEALKRLGQTRLPATLWNTQFQMSSGLSQITQEIDMPLSNIPCPDGIPSDKAKILRNVFALFFVDKIQPLGSQLNHFHYQLASITDRLLLSPFSPDFINALEQKMLKDFERYQVSMRDHVKLWQRFFKRCNLTPGKTAV